jgi:hypothetical protein
VLVGEILMVDNLLLRLYSSQVEAAEAAVEAWKAEHQEAMRARDLEDLVRSCLDYPAILMRVCNATFAKMRDGALEAPNETRQALHDFFEKTLDYLRGIRDLAARFQRDGHLIAGLTELENALEQCRALKERIFEFWSPFTSQDVAEGLAEHARGECLELDEAFAQIAGVSKEAWLKRVEEQQQRKHA